MDDAKTEIDISDQALTQIQNRVLEAEEAQRSYRKPHDIIPEIKRIIEDEIQPSDVPGPDE